MKEHYGLSDAQYSTLVKSGVTDRDLFKNVALFDPHGTSAPISQVSLYYYIDEKGNFNDPPHSHAHKKIALCVFENLKIKEKIAVSEYLESWEEGFEDD